jgi:outer membrane protein TolC
MFKGPLETRGDAEEIYAKIFIQIIFMWNCYASAVRPNTNLLPTLGSAPPEPGPRNLFRPETWVRRTGGLKWEENNSMGDANGPVSGGPEARAVAVGDLRGDLRVRRTSVKRLPLIAAGLAIAWMVPAASVAAQEANPSQGVTPEPEVQFIRPPQAQAAPPVTITFQDALEKARKLDPTLIGATSDARIAHEDRTQARNAFLPTFSASTQYLNTQGNGKTPDGRYVTNDGIHVYRQWVIYHQDLSPGLLMGTGYTRAKAAEALANAKAEIARRGLGVTVTKAYYALVVAQRKYATAQTALDQTRRFLNITLDLEKQGQGSHSDTVNAEVQYRTQLQAFDEARFLMEDTRLGLAVIIFSDFNENFTVVDDIENAPALPPFSEAQAMAEKENPDLRVALEAARESDLDVKLAKTAFLPTITVDTNYGIEANCFSFGKCVQAAIPTVGPVETPGYFLTAVLNLPLWDFGTLRSKLKQADYKQETAKAQLSFAQRTLVSELYATYDEAMVAKSAVEESRRTAELAQESLRLMTLRFQGGASTATDVTVAQTALITAQNAYADALVRYRTLLSTLQTFTGRF